MAQLWRRLHALLKSPHETATIAERASSVAGTPSASATADTHSLAAIESNGENRNLMQRDCNAGIIFDV